MTENGSGSKSSLLMSFVKMYGTLPLHGITAIPGKISGALMLADAIEDAVPLIHGPVGCAFQRKVNPFKPHSPFYTTPCTNMNDTDVVYGGEEKLEQGIRETYERPPQPDRGDHHMPERSHRRRCRSSHKRGQFRGWL